MEMTIYYRGSGTPNDPVHGRVSEAAQQLGARLHAAAEESGSSWTGWHERLSQAMRCAHLLVLNLAGGSVRTAAELCEAEIQGLPTIVLDNPADNSPFAARLRERFDREETGIHFLSGNDEPSALLNTMAALIDRTAAPRVPIRS